MDEFIRHCTELLAPLGSVRVKRMFGGHGLYVDELFIAIIMGEELYLKVDEQTRPQFEAAGGKPFRYATKEGGHVALSYFQPPEEAMESPALMVSWERLAIDAALRARMKKVKPKAKPKPKGACTPVRGAGR